MTTSHAFPLEPTAIDVSDKVLDDLRRASHTEFFSTPAARVELARI